MTRPSRWKKAAARHGYVLDERFLVTGEARYWIIQDLQTSRRYPAGYNTFFPSMKEARREAEELARSESEQR